MTKQMKRKRAIQEEQKRKRKPKRKRNHTEALKKKITDSTVFVEEGKTYRIIEEHKVACFPSGYLKTIKNDFYCVIYGRFFLNEKVCSKYEAKFNMKLALYMYSCFGFSSWMGDYIDRSGNPVIVVKEKRKRKPKRKRRVKQIEVPKRKRKRKEVVEEAPKRKRKRKGGE